MVPIYSVDSWMALRFPGAAIYFDTCRECYEAYVIYNFMIYLLNFLNSEYDVNPTLEAKPQQRHLIPFCCLTPWKNGGQLIHKCKQGVLAYTVIRPLTTIIALICELAGKYTEGDFSLSSAWFYIMLINNITQIWALYCLVLFYKATREELKPIKPVAKFLCVKLVIFFSFWQAVFIAFLVAIGVIKGNESLDLDAETIATALQDFIICIEMFIAAIAHHFSFAYQPFIDENNDTAPWYTSFMAMWDVSDVKDDVVEHVKSVGSTVGRNMKSAIIPKRRGNLTEHTPLLEDFDNQPKTASPSINTKSPYLHPNTVKNTVTINPQNSSQEGQSSSSSMSSSGEITAAVQFEETEDGILVDITERTKDKHTTL